MLVLSRKVGESIRIGEGISLEVRRVYRNRVVLAVVAPKEVSIHRRPADNRESPRCASPSPFFPPILTPLRPGRLPSGENSGCGHIKPAIG